MVEVFNKKWPTSLKLDEDDWINIYVKYKWGYWKDKSNNFYLRTTKHLNTFLHKLILNSNLEVDHINGDTLDNRRCNLRIATHQQNLRNQKKTKNKTSSKYKGVSFHEKTKKWRACIYLNKVQINLKLHETEEEAALAYNKAAIGLFGEFAKLNTIE